MNTQKLSKTQIVAFIAAGVGMLFAFVSALVPQIQIAGNIAYNLLIALGIDSVSAFVGTAKGYAERTKEEIDKLTAKKEQKEYEQAKAQTNAIRSVTSIFDGGLTRTMEEELAMTSVTDTINESIAEMNRMLDGSNQILANFEIDNDINADKADAILEMFDNNGFSIFEEPQKKETGKYILTHTKEAEYEEIPTREKEAVKLPSSMSQSKYFN